MLNDNLNSICMIDMHAHLLCLSEEYRGKLTEQEMFTLAAQELAARREYGIDTVFSCGTPQEWEFMRKCLTQSADMEAKRGSKDSVLEKQYEFGNSFALSFGIHPWYSDRFDPREYREYFAVCPIVGEIGMDSVWCDVPLDVQRRVFAQQLEIAAEFEKPVILHTKGQERQIAEMTQDFPGKICVHWYSGGETEFETFLEAGCYFTLGPDLAENFKPLYQRMLREVPAERLFLETDGLSSIAWMRGREIGAVSFEDISEVLEKNLKFAAREKRMQSGLLYACLKENLHEFAN